MTADEWERLKPLLERALEAPPEERARLLEQIEREDPKLADDLVCMIEANELETDFLNQPLVRLDQILSADTPSFSEGQVVGRFRIVRMLGHGGMGEVYEADDIELGRIAIKTIRRGAATPRALLRFKQEVQLARKVTSPYVCRIHELYLEPAVFLSMELLPGRTLGDRIEQEGALPYPEAERIAQQLCMALQAMHNAGVIHRDLKTRNVMLTPRHGIVQAVVMDLGLAREAEPKTADGSGISLPGAVMGTPEYMAPEQFEGGNVTPATDIYALGVVLYELITGTRPFQAPNAVAAAVRRAKHPPSVSSVHPGLPHHWDAVIDRCLQYEAEDRYQSADEVAAALLNRPSRAAQVRRAMWSSRSRQAAALAIVALIIVIASLLWYRWHRSAGPSADAMHWYDTGVTALREGTYLKAIRSLEHAVELDGNFALAHARLADAWNELDFTGKARQEMLQASSLEQMLSLSKIDQRYLSAVQRTLTRQFSAAVKDYQAILSALPQKEKAYGYLDLGRAFEKAGNIAEARKNYSAATKLASEYPGSFVRLGILEDRNGESTPAEDAFAHARSLYDAASNTEGIAEIDYQRGYDASLRHDLPAARAFLERSLRAAKEMPSPQLEIRALTRMSMVEYDADNYDKAIDLENSAIQLAQENGIEYWATEGIIRMGGIYLERNDYGKAEAFVSKGLQLARDNQVPRLEALAHLNLANIRNQQGRADDTILEAQAALNYYQRMGFFDTSINALQLILRSRRDKAEFEQALLDATQVFEATKKSGNLALIAQVEELVGSILLSLERYPEALGHFQAARAAAGAVGELGAYQSYHCADTLWRLGRYKEADQMIGSIPAKFRSEARITELVDLSRAGMYESQGKFQQALGIARHALTAAPAPTPETIFFKLIVGSAQAQLGSASESLQMCQEALSSAQNDRDVEETAQAELCVSGAYLTAGSPREAIPLAEAARVFFAHTHQEESECRSLRYLAEASRASGNKTAGRTFAQKGLDIFSNFEHNWEIPTYRGYISRPDIQVATRELTALARE